MKKLFKGYSNGNAVEGPTRLYRRSLLGPGGCMPNETQAASLIPRGDEKSYKEVSKRSFDKI